MRPIASKANWSYRSYVFEYPIRISNARVSFSRYKNAEAKSRERLADGRPLIADIRLLMAKARLEPREVEKRR